MKPECLVEVSSPSSSPHQTLCRINGKMVPLLSLSLTINCDDRIRVVLEVEPTGLEIVTNALAEVVVVGDD